MKLRFYIFRIAGTAGTADLWGLTAGNLKQAELSLEMDARTAGHKRVLHYMHPTSVWRELVNLSTVKEED